LQRAPENTPDASPVSLPEGFPTWLVHPRAFQPGHAARRLCDLADPPEGFPTWLVHPKAFQPGHAARRLCDLADPPEGFTTWLVHPKVFQPSHAARRPRDLAEPPEGFSTRPIHPRVSRPTLFQIRRSITVQLHTQFFCWEGQVKSNRQITFLVDNLCITSWQLVNPIILSKLQK